MLPAPRRGRRALAALGCVALLSGCVPLFLPPVPSDAIVATPGWRIAGSAELRHRVEGGVGGLALHLRFDEVPTAAWVAVQWFGPAGGERASGSWWVTPDDVGAALTWPAPADLALSPGRWRAVVSVGDRWLRQVEVEVDVAP